MADEQKVTALSVYLPPDLRRALETERERRNAAAARTGDFEAGFRAEERSRLVVCILREVLDRRARG